LDQNALLKGGKELYNELVTYPEGEEILMASSYLISTGLDRGLMGLNADLTFTL